MHCFHSPALLFAEPEPQGRFQNPEVTRCTLTSLTHSVVVDPLVNEFRIYYVRCSDSQVGSDKLNIFNDLSHVATADVDCVPNSLQFRRSTGGTPVLQLQTFRDTFEDVPEMLRLYQLGHRALLPSLNSGERIGEGKWIEMDQLLVWPVIFPGTLLRTLISIFSRPLLSVLPHALLAALLPALSRPLSRALLLILLHP